MQNWFRNLKVRGKLLFSFVIVLAVAVGSGCFALVNMKAIDDSYTEAMIVTSERIEYIFEAKDHLALVQKTMLELYYPSTTRADIERVHGELYQELSHLEDNLNKLYEVASPEVREEVNMILPLVERYKTDIDDIITRLLNAGTISPDNPDYRTALLRAEQMTKSIGENYGNEMMESINNLSDLALYAVMELIDENGVKADSALLISIIIFVAMVVLVLFIAVYISGLISRPMVPFGAFLKRAGALGDITVYDYDVKVIEEFVKYDDEIGNAIRGAVSFVAHVDKMSKEIEAVARGDLTAEIEPLSEFDTMGLSLKHMIDGLNFMFEEVHAATNQASMGSKHVAHGAQALAQNSAEQSTSVENLSRAISDITLKTETNFDTAEKTAKLSETIKANAEKGALLMGELMDAVKEINSASQAISRIMSAIDDISFQTNLLALNAAVEAARAGQHGKGFAIVAEEVRKLALRSTEAAKETGELIQNSIEKAELGVRIAGETADSFAEIVAGIGESNVLIGTITYASEEQKQGINQINNGIDQVARIVQQNSATAEESAAASEEMSTQASILQELMTRFKIKERKFLS